MEEQIPNITQDATQSTPPVVINMPDYTPYYEQQISLLESLNELLMYAASGIWFLVATILIAVFFIAKGAGNNS
jgi:type IV secretory pathway VirB6-like protein